MWPTIAAVAPVMANAATIIGLIFVVLQLRTAARSARVQAWAFLLDTSNKRWSAYGSAVAERERTFALGELLNFFEVLAGDVIRRKLPAAIVEQVAPYLVGAIAMMSRDDQMAGEIRALRVNDKTFCDLRAFSGARITDFGDYPRVARLFASVSADRSHAN
jgi:hypothetical protein